MYAIGLMLAATFFAEVSSSMGKRAVAKRLESIYSLGFLSTFWTALLLILSVVFLGADFHFSQQSLPVFLPRLGLELATAYVSMKAVVKADRSTYAFLRLITVPLLLAVDIILGYPVGGLQMLGILMVFGAIMVLIHHGLNRKGGGYVIASALCAVGTISLYKYDITHYNSVAAEQILTYIVLLTFFTILAWNHSKEKTWPYLRWPWAEAQSISEGAANVLASFAFNFAPASVVVSAQRGLSVLWAIIFGNVYFHERHVVYKLSCFVLVAVGLTLTIIN